MARTELRHDPVFAEWIAVLPMRLSHHQEMPRRNDDRRREAILRAFSGDDLATIARRLGATEAQVQNWLAEGAPRAPRHFPRSKEPSWDRRQLAEELLRTMSFIEVYMPEDDESEERQADLFVSFEDVAAHEFYDLVEASVDVLSAFTGVQGATHYDRELIFIDGRVDPAALEEHLLNWWKGRLAVIASTEID